jgi:hypothetical protein
LKGGEEYWMLSRQYGSGATGDMTPQGQRYDEWAWRDVDARDNVEAVVEEITRAKDGMSAE